MFYYITRGCLWRCSVLVTLRTHCALWLRDCRAGRHRWRHCCHSWDRWVRYLYKRLIQTGLFVKAYRDYSAFLFGFANISNYCGKIFPVGVVIETIDKDLSLLWENVWIKFVNWKKEHLQKNKTCWLCFVLKFYIHICKFSNCKSEISFLFIALVRFLSHVTKRL